MKQVPSVDFTSSDEEDPDKHQKKKKILTWQSKLLTTKNVCNWTSLISSEQPTN